MHTLISQQQTVYTNYLLNQYLYNPAYAGVYQGTSFNVGYRNQWVGFDGAPVSFLANGYGTFKKKPNMNVGAYVTTEKIGLFQRTTFGGTYTYHLKINKKADINFGLGLGGIQHKVRVYDANPYDKDDAAMSSDVLNGFAFDASAGFYFYTKNYFLGFSSQQMPNSKILWTNSIGRNTTHYYLYTGYNIPVDKKKEWIIQPSLLLRTNAPTPHQLEGHVRGIFKQIFWLGFSYRQLSSAGILAGCNINKQFVFSYDYDFTLTALNHYSSGSHEIVLSYFIPFKKKKSKAEMQSDADEQELNTIDNSLKTNLRSKKQEEKENKTDSGDGKTEMQPVEESPQQNEESNAPQQELNPSEVPPTEPATEMPEEIKPEVQEVEAPKEETPQAPEQQVPEETSTSEIKTESPEPVDTESETPVETKQETDPN